MQWLNSLSMNLLNKDLDGLWARQQAISDNLANFETPGYKPKTVSFEDQLRAMLSSSAEKESELVKKVGDVSPVMTTQDDLTLRLDGNGVDFEKENVEFLRTEFNYDTSLRLLSDTFSRLRTVINAGK